MADERGPIQLAERCHGRVKSSQDTIEKALEGDYRPEHLFTLKQSLADYRYYAKLARAFRASETWSIASEFGWRRTGSMATYRGSI